MNLFLSSSINSVAVDIFQRSLPLMKNKQLIFISTAAEVIPGDKSWLYEERQALVDAGYEVTDYSLTDQNKEQVLSALDNKGTIFVSGGNNYFLISEIRKSGFDQIIKALVSNDIIYLGSSAGSVVAGPDVETELDDRSVVENLTDFKGMNLTDVSVRPHWGSSTFSKVYESETKLLYNIEQKLVLLNDQQYIHVKDDWYQIITVG